MLAGCCRGARRGGHQRGRTEAMLGAQMRLAPAIHKTRLNGAKNTRVHRMTHAGTTTSSGKERITALTQPGAAGKTKLSRAHRPPLHAISEMQTSLKICSLSTTKRSSIQTFVTMSFPFSGQRTPSRLVNRGSITLLSTQECSEQSKKFATTHPKSQQLLP